MSNVRASRQPDPAYFREFIRIWFIYHLMRHPKVDEIADRLRPAWERALEVSYDPVTLRSAHFTELPRQERTLIAYIAALESAVLGELRCTENGTPAQWVCHALHGLIAQHESVPFPYPSDMTPQQSGEVRLTVMAAGGAGVASFVDNEIIGGKESVTKVGMLHTDPPNAPDEAGILPAALDAFSDWDELKDAARQHLDQLIDELRKRVEQHTQEWPKYYRKGSETLIRKTLPRIVAYLVDQEQLFSSDRTSIYPALRQLGLDKARDVEKLALKGPKHSYTRSRKQR